MKDYKPITDFWIKQIGPEGWYNGPPELDAMIRERFMVDWEVARDGGYLDWTDTASGCLAYLILTDQFPRNMFRDDARAFATDPLARIVALQAIRNDFDLQVGTVAQEFFYLPFEHSENMAEQLLCETYISTRMKDFEVSLWHARAHQEIIRLFGRFPYRNKALTRDATVAEQEFLDGNGYQKILQAIQNRG